MSEKLENSHISPEDQALDRLRPSLRQLWMKLQRKFHLQGFDVLTFLPKNGQDNYWKLNLKTKNYPTPFSEKERGELKKRLIHVFDFQGNEDLFLLFQEQHSIPFSFWQRMETSLQANGFFVSNDELEFLKDTQIEKHLNYLKLFSQKFPFHFFLQSIKEEFDRANFRPDPIPLPVLAIWFYFKYFIPFLQKIATEDREMFDEISSVLLERISLDNIAKEMTMEQVVKLIMLACVFHRSVDQQMKWQDKILSRATSETKLFWERFGPSLNHYCSFGFTMLLKGKWPEQVPKANRKLHAEKKIKQAFFNLAVEELKIIAVQELLDDRSEKGFLAKASKALQLKFRPQQDLSFGDKVKQALGGASILERIQDSVEKTIQEPLAHFAPAKKRWMEEDGPKWYDLSDADRKELQTSFLEEAAFAYHALIGEAGKRQLIYFQNLGNAVMAPFFLWENIEDSLVPQWNVFSDKERKRLLERYEKRRAEEMKEAERLEGVLKRLPKIDTEENMETFRGIVDDFKIPYFQKQWLLAFERRATNIRNKIGFRIRKMYEFGILEKGEGGKRGKEIWLDEMLQIEKEVSPYISFVKRAFQSALPIRKSIEFNPYRHSIDGVEFDAETLQQPDKWIRGEVMKTLQMKVDRADAEQINAFAMDSSGSMRGEKMRNLFKIIFLLVLGLEDRKTYDAFHFFGTSFIEAANLSNDYTNRSLLFNILRNIASIKRGKVVYAGRGGTNISDGVFQCHERIMAFSEKLKKEKPDVHHLKSIFVITDGEPSIGIVNVDELHEAIKEKRADGNVAIKGIYLKAQQVEGEEIEETFMEDIFGRQQYVESSEFNEILNQFVYIMSLTYKLQRKELKSIKKKK